MTAKELFAYAVEQATAVMVQVEDSQLKLPTPDTEWDVRTLMNHMVYELAWVADIVAGKTIAEVGKAYDGDLLGDDAVEVWRRYLERAREAVADCDEKGTAHLSYGDISVADYLFEAGNDQLIHAWDLGQAIGVSVVFDEAVAKQLYDIAAAQGDGLSASGMYAAPVPIPDSANIQTKLLAILGRSEDWAEKR